MCAEETSRLFHNMAVYILLKPSERLSSRLSGSTYIYVLFSSCVSVSLNTYLDNLEILPLSPFWLSTDNAPRSF